MRDVRKCRNWTLMFKNLWYFLYNYNTSTHLCKNTTHPISANTHLSGGKIGNVISFLFFFVFRVISNSSLNYINLQIKIPSENLTPQISLFAVFNIKLLWNYIVLNKSCKIALPISVTWHSNNRTTFVVLDKFWFQSVPLLVGSETKEMFHVTHHQ